MVSILQGHIEFDNEGVRNESELRVYQYSPSEGTSCNTGFPTPTHFWGVLTDCPEF